VSAERVSGRYQGQMVARQSRWVKVVETTRRARQWSSSAAAASDQDAPGLQAPLPQGRGLRRPALRLYDGARFSSHHRHAQTVTPGPESPAHKRTMNVFFDVER